MNRNIKYMGITAAALLAVAPIAAPVFNSATEITAKADTVNEDTKTSTSATNTKVNTDNSISTDESITPAQKGDAQKWGSQMKSSFRVTKGIPLLDSSDVEAVYIGGSDGLFDLRDGSTLTPQSYLSKLIGKKDEFFMHFNDNKDKSNIYFSSYEDDKADNYEIFATATANDGTIKRNLQPYEINQFLEEKGGKGVTFHFGVHYVENPIMGNGTWDQYLGKDSKQVASKDVVVLPLEADSTDTGSNTNTGSTTNTGSNTNTGSTTNTGSNTNTGSTTNTDSNTSTGNTTNTNTNTSTTNDNDNQTTTPATSYHSVYTSTKGIKLYDDKGELIDSVNLGKNTTWRVDQKQVIKGVTYLRVATNEWVREDNGFEVELINSVVTTNKKAALYNSKGEKITSHVLGSKTPWRTDRTAQINGKTMYRVATDEWVLASDVQ